MKQKLNTIIPLTILTTLILTACQLPRPGGDAGNIDIPPPEVSPVVEAPPSPEAPASPDVPQPPPTEESQAAEISREPVPAPLAPNAIEPGQVLLKLTQSAAIQARSAELGPLNVPETDINSLDERLIEIGASDLEPVLEDVARVIGQEIDTLSAQSAQVGQLFSVTFSPDQNPADVANRLAQDPNVEFAEPNYIAGITAEPHTIPARFDPNDPYYAFQWNMQAIQMPRAWDTSTGKGVIVAIVDTGIDFNAPDLANTLRLPGHDFANDDADPTDDQGHGTHVAGTIAQSTNNGTGVAGVAYNAQLLPVKALGANGNGSYANIIKGITYAVNQGAKVINLSLAGRQGSQALLEAVQFAHSQGVVVVAAAGNSNGPVEFPAAYDDFVIAVGATRFDNQRARYSNFGPQIDLVAPGGDVGVDQNGDTYADGIIQQSFRTPGNYTYLFFEGTSMASPHVAGVAALIISRKSDATPAEVEALMVQTAGALGPADEYGAGIVRAADALAGFNPLPPDPTDTPTPEPPTPTPIPATDTPTPVPTINTPTPEPPSPPDTPTPTLEAPQPPDTPTPTPTPALPTSDPTLAGQLLRNAGFESDDGWLILDTPIRAEYDSSVVLDGSRAIRLGNVAGPDFRSFTSIRQEVTIPAEASQVTLTVNIYPVSEDEAGTDLQTILVLNRSGRVIKTLARELSNSQNWETRSFDISDLSGQTIFVYLGVFNRGGTGRPSAMYVDNISLDWSP